MLGVAHDVMSSRVVPGRAAESDGAGTDAREPWAAGYYILFFQDVASVVSTSHDIFRSELFWLLFCLFRQAAL